MYLKTRLESWLREEVFFEVEEVEDFIFNIEKLYKLFIIKEQKNELPNPAIQNVKIICWKFILCTSYSYNNISTISNLLLTRGDMNLSDILSAHGDIELPDILSAHSNLEPPAILPANCDHDVTPDKIQEYATDLYQKLEFLLNQTSTVEIKINRDSLTINNEIFMKKKHFGVITAAHNLQQIKSIYNPYIFDIYKNDKWRSQIEKSCGKLRVIGFQTYNYPSTEKFYTNPKFELAKEKTEKTFDDLTNIIEQADTAIFAIKGKSGLGKTSLLKRLAMLCYTQEIKKGFIPVYISLRQSSLQDSSNEGIFERYISTLDEQGIIIEKEKIRKIFEDGKALILIDGLNDNYHNTTHHSGLIETLISRFPKNFYVISSKTTEADSSVDMTLQTLAQVMSESLGTSHQSDENFLKIFNLKEFDKKDITNFINKYFSEFKSNQTDVIDEVEIHELFLPYSDSLGSPLLLSCFCFCRTQLKFSKLKKDLFKIGITKLVAQWEYFDDHLPNTINPYYELKELRIQFLGFLATQFMAGENNQGNQAGVAVKIEDAAKWIIEFFTKPENFINHSELLPSAKVIKEKFLKASQEIDGDLSLASFNNLAIKILSSIEFQHGLIVEKGSDVGFIHGEIQKFLITNSMQEKFIEMREKYQQLGGDWSSVLAQIDNNSAPAILLNELETLKLQVLKDLKESSKWTEKDDNYKSVDSALKKLIELAFLANSLMDTGNGDEIVSVKETLKE